MIVVDTNVIAYACIEGVYTPLAHQVRKLDPEWRLPTLWRHELLNVLATYVQYGGARIEEILPIWGRAVKLFSPCERVVDMTFALQIAVEYNVSAYDAQFIVLAESLAIPCITEDFRLLKTFPHRAISMKKFCDRF